MRKTIINCAVAAVALCSFAAPVFADDVIIRDRSYHSDRYNGDHDRARPGITISDQGVSFGAVRSHDRDRVRYRDNGCVTKSVTRQTDDGAVTKTVKRSN